MHAAGDAGVAAFVAANPEIKAGLRRLRSEGANRQISRIDLLSSIFEAAKRDSGHNGPYVVSNALRVARPSAWRFFGGAFRDHLDRECDATMTMGEQREWAVRALLGSHEAPAVDLDAWLA